MKRFGVTISVVAFVLTMFSCRLFDLIGVTDMGDLASASDLTNDLMLAEYSTNLQPEGLIGEWLFNGDALDTSGRSNNGQVIGSPILTNDRFGNPTMAYYFDGVDDQILLEALPFTTIDSVPNSFTLSFWIYSDSFKSGAQNRIFSQGDGYHHDVLVHVESGILKYEIWPREGQKYQISGIQTSNWYHIVLVRDGEDSTFYINNVAQTTHSTLELAGGAEFATNAYIGGVYDYHYFKGIIDDVRVYNGVLSVSEISNLYVDEVSSSPVISTNNLIGEWLFEGDANDTSVWENDGTVNGAMLTNDRFDNPQSAYYFDGVNDNITIDALAFTKSSNIPSQFTTSYWIKPNGITIGSQGRTFGETDGLNNFNLLQFEEGGKIIYQFYPSSSSKYYGPFVTNMDWYHIVMIKNQTTNTFIVNNTVYTSFVDSSLAGGTTNSPFTFIGGIGGHYFDGTIDDVRVYDRILDSTEISNLFTETD